MATYSCRIRKQQRCETYSARFRHITPNEKNQFRLGTFGIQTESIREVCNMLYGAVEYFTDKVFKRPLSCLDLAKHLQQWDTSGVTTKYHKLYRKKRLKMHPDKSSDINNKDFKMLTNHYGVLGFFFDKMRTHRIPLTSNYSLFHQWYTSSDPLSRVHLHQYYDDLRVTTSSMEYHIAKVPEDESFIHDIYYGVSKLFEETIGVYNTHSGMNTLFESKVALHRNAQAKAEVQVQVLKEAKVEAQVSGHQEATLSLEAGAQVQALEEAEAKAKVDTQVQALEEAKAKAEAQVQDLKKAKGKVKVQVKALKAEVKYLKDKVQTLSASQQNLQAQVKELSDTKETLSASQEDLQDQVKELSDAKETVDDYVTELQTQIESLRQGSSVEELKVLKARNEELHKQVEALNKNRRQSREMYEGLFKQSKTYREQAVTLQEEKEASEVKLQAQAEELQAQAEDLQAQAEDLRTAKKEVKSQARQAKSLKRKLDQVDAQADREHVKKLQIIESNAEKYEAYESRYGSMTATHYYHALGRNEWKKYEVKDTNGEFTGYYDATKLVNTMMTKNQSRGRKEVLDMLRTSGKTINKAFAHKRRYYSTSDEFDILWDYCLDEGKNALYKRLQALARDRRSISHN